MVGLRAVGSGGDDGGEGEAVRSGVPHGAFDAPGDLPLRHAGPDPGCDRLDGLVGDLDGPRERFEFRRVLHRTELVSHAFGGHELRRGVERLQLLGQRLVGGDGHRIVLDADVPRAGCRDDLREPVVAGRHVDHAVVRRLLLRLLRVAEVSGQRRVVRRYPEPAVRSAEPGVVGDVLAERALRVEDEHRVEPILCYAGAEP